MCAIVASFNKTKLKELFALNAYRGQLSYSCSAIAVNPINGFALERHKGEMPDTYLDKFMYSMPFDYYYVGHTQAPTTESSSIHPATNNNVFLWHNGIIKQGTFDGDWDTEWILKGIQDKKVEFLSEIDGTFACMLFDNNSKELFVFRNEISPLFYDTELNFSSTKFDGSLPLEPNIVWRIDLATKVMQNIGIFTTKVNPYYFGD